MTYEDIQPVVAKYPRLNFLLSPEFHSLPKGKQDFLLECVEDALFWVEAEKDHRVDDGIRALAIAYTRLLSNEPIDVIEKT